MPTGILLLDKPLGLSSNAALQRVRSLFAREKAGHVGSLDPLATGMLPICLGEATKIAGDILAGRKRYRFAVKLGVQTASGDAEGAVISTAPVRDLDRAALESVLAGFRGPQQQIPPMYSALKRDGQPLYRLARAGVTVARDARAIELFELTLLNLQPPQLELEALCSKGTYIRVLAEDIAAALGTCGHITALRRVCVEPFAQDSMVTLEALAEGPATLLPADWPLMHLPAVHLSAAQAQRIRQGQRVLPAEAAGAGRVRLYDASRRFFGIGESDAGGVLPRRLFNLAPEA
jgi:tRNA pseudouridine55 synthase